MINTNNNLPRTAQKQLKKVTQSTMIIDRHQRVETKQEDTSEEPEKQQANKHKKGLLDIYV
jgi:peroxiredoxin